MANMFGANPFVFDRSQILGEQYSPQALYPGLFGQGGTFAPGGMLGPPQQGPGPLPTIPPMQQPGTPPGLMPWDPVQPLPTPPQETPGEPVAPVYEEMPSFVSDYVRAMGNTQRNMPVGSHGNQAAIRWLRENQGSLSPMDAANYAVAQQAHKEAMRRFNMK